MSPSTPGEVLVPGAIAIVFVVAWFVFGLVDATRGDRTDRRPAPQPARHARDDTAYDTAYDTPHGRATTRTR